MHSVTPRSAIDGIAQAERVGGALVGLLARDARQQRPLLRRAEDHHVAAEVAAGRRRARPDRPRSAARTAASGEVR